MTKIYKVVRDRWGTCNLFLWNHVDTLFFIPLMQGDFSVCWSFLVLGRYQALIIDFFSSLSCNYLFLWIIVLFFLSFIIILSFVVCICNTYFDKFDITIVPYISFEVIYKWFFILKVEQMLCQFVMLFLFWYFTQCHLLDV